MTGTQWTVRLAQAAERDFAAIIRWTAEEFGRRQARFYADTLSSALIDLMAGPTLLGVRSRDDIARGLFTVHVARRRRKGRHFVLFRLAACEDHVIEVLRLLHESMDVTRHLPS